MALTLCCTFLAALLPGVTLGSARTLEIQCTAPMLQKLVSDARATDSEVARGEILALNPSLLGLEVSRNGDQVTVIFSPRGNSAPASLYLAGGKRDFYLLAMAEDPTGVLARLGGLDPQILATTASRSGQQLTLRLDYAVAEAATPPPLPMHTAGAAAGSDDAVFAAARGSEDALERYLAQFPGGAHRAEAERDLEALGTARMEAEYEAALATGDPAVLRAFMAELAAGTKVGRRGREVRLQVRGPTDSFPVSSEPAAVPVTLLEAPPIPAPPPAPPPDPEPSLEQRAEGPYQAALAQGTVAALEQFAAAFPDAPQHRAAKQRIAELREQVAYKLAVEKNSVEAYQGFLAIFPASGRRAEAEARVRALLAERDKVELERRAAELARKAQQTDRERRQRAFDQARQLDSPEAYSIFLTTYPATPEAREAEQRLKELQDDAAAFNQAQGSEVRLEQYLATRPNGRHAAAARDQLGQLQDARMEAQFQAARAAGSIDVWQRFSQDWPAGSRAVEAKAQLEALKLAAAKPVPPAAPPKATEVLPPALRLSVRYAAVAPEVDGLATDGAWLDAPPLEVALSGSQGLAGRATLRAVHDGTSLYVLAEWADPTRNEGYRSWLWDAKEDNYQQSDERDDAFAVSLYRDGSSLAACMLAGAEIDADLWLWRAHWGALSGLADDGRLRVSRQRIPQANPYPTRTGHGQVWIRQDWDDGQPGWKLFIPVERTGGVLPGYQTAPAQGSRGDVQAVGAWSETSGGRWRVEFRRALDTRHPDDVAVRPGTTVVAAFATYDRADRADHASSPPVFLDIQGN